MARLSGCLMLKNFDFPFQTVAKVHPGGLGIGVGLDAGPELHRVTEKAGKAQRCIGADTPSPRHILLMRMTGTLMSWASRYWLMSKGFRNSSRSISPGCTGGKSLMVFLPHIYSGL